MYLRAFWASRDHLCAWCREAVGTAALAALPAVAPLPDGLSERLTTLIHHPHDYPRDAWDETLRRHGGAAGVVRLLAAGLSSRQGVRQFEGRRRGDLLAGVCVTTPGTSATYELVDRRGAVWTVRAAAGGVVRKRRAWAWERAGEERVAQLLPRILELSAR